MTTCRMCPQPLPPGRRVFCGDDCYRAWRAADFRARYHADPDFRARDNARGCAWSKANRERHRASARASQRRAKAARFAAVLERVPRAGEGAGHG